jgi:aminoglycoside phosphotransferase (APT) family kinase protein
MISTSATVAVVTEPLASGRDADVFALDDRRVLRRYRRAADVTAEAAIMAHVGSYGYPVPDVYDAYGPDLIMERIDGPTMAQALIAGEIGVPDGAALLADLLGRLHEVPAPPGAAGGACVVHLDLHPENVMLTAAGPKVIDWCNATAGAADLDTALSALIVAQVAIGSIDHPMGPAAGEFLDRFLALAPGDPVRLLDDALALRLANVTMSADELAALPSAAARVRDGR